MMSIHKSAEVILNLLGSLPDDLQISGVFAGISGLSSAQMEDEFIRILHTFSHIKISSPIVVKSDSYTALLSMNGDLEGIALILGTNSSCFGIRHGESFRVGGYPFMEGDAGSAYDLGNQALKYYARVLDHRINESNFSRAIGDLLKIHSISELDDYFVHFDRVKVAELAKLVTKFAPINQYAYQILASAADEAKLMVEAVYRTLHFEGTSLVFAGGLIQADTMYRNLVFQNIKKINSLIQIESPLYSPAQAAALYIQRYDN